MFTRCHQDGSPPRRDWSASSRRQPLAVVALAAAFSVHCAVSIDDQLWQCETSSDCGGGWQCDPSLRYCVEAYNGQNGVFDDRLVIGMTAYLSQDIPGLAVISAEGIAGINAYFRFVNSTGGIHGRRLELRALDDRFDPMQAQANMMELVGAQGGERQVFLVCNTLGEPPSLAAADVAVNEKVILWSPGTGLTSLEQEPPSRYIFNYRPRYSDESDQLTRYLLDELQPNTPATNIGVLAQGSDFEGAFDLNGDDVVNGTTRALGVGRGELFATTYVLGSTDILEPAKRTLKWMASADRETTGDRRYVGIILGSVWDAGSGFIKAIQDQLSAARRGVALDAPFAADLDATEIARLATVEVRYVAHSAITTNALRAALASFGPYPWIDDQGQATQRTYGAGLVISQVVPLATSNSSGAIRYREHLAAFDPSAVPGEFSLESYLNMWLLGEALQAHGRDLTTETFIQTLEQFSVDLGVGTPLGFSIGSHQATSRVWGIRLSDDLSVEWLGLLLPD